MTSVCDISDGTTTTADLTTIEILTPTTASAATADSLATILAGVLGVETVGHDSHFFDDLGADSLVMARFCARVRKREDLPAVSMRDIYQASTVADLTRRLVPPSSDGTGGDGAQATGAQASSTAAGVPTAQEAAPGPVSAGSGPILFGADPAPQGQLTWRMAPALCGVAQLSWMVAYSMFGMLVLASGYSWIADGAGVLEKYLRAAVVGAGVMALWISLPILLKWLLVGRWRPRTFPIWGWTYLRFWMVKAVIRTNPLAVFFAGSPLYVVYLRALGAKIGPGAVILTRRLPICTDLLTVGAGTVIRKDASLSCYRARGQCIETGSVTLGREAFVGEFAVLDIGTSMGERAQLGHASSLHTDQVIPDGQSWHGTPAQPSPTTYRLVDDASARHPALRRFTYSTTQLAVTMLLVLPVLVGFVEALVLSGPLVRLLDPLGLVAHTWLFYLEAVVVAGVVFVGLLIIRFGIAVTLPRLLSSGLVAGRSYPMYGWHYALHRGVGILTNARTFTALCGDSSYIVGFLRSIGYRLRPVEQTGSNFGMAVKHENPYLSTVGSGTMVADGLSILNVEYSATTFRLAPTRIGAHSFLGNHIVYPAGSRAGDNVLLATKVAVPMNGPMRENVGLLGSPAFEIPRTVRRDVQLKLGTRREFKRQLYAKNRHNLRTMAVHLSVNYGQTYALIILLGLTLDFYPMFGPAVVALFAVGTLVLSLGYWVVIERLFSHLQLLAPQGCSIYDPAFWGHERYWKANTEGLRQMAVFDGTPLKSLMWRLMGVRVGRRLFDDGCAISERRFIDIGDDCTLNAGSILQSHSQEDGAFKSDGIRIGSRCTVGVGALVHYGVSVGDDVEFGPDSFVMKGEEVPTGAHWVGNPARAIVDQSHRRLTSVDSGDQR